MNRKSFIAAAATCLLLAGTLSAGTPAYQIDWYTVDGGGGLSSGGAYTVSGTIGQPDAGTLTGGAYTLNGGFMTWGATVSPTGAPELTVALAGHQVIITWPSQWTGFQLEYKISLDEPGWTPVPAVPSDNGSTKQVVLTLAGTSQFFRLAKP